MKISSFGEVLRDDFPGGKSLGGAPPNDLPRLAELGADRSNISRRGRDADGVPAAASPPTSYKPTNSTPPVWLKSC